MNVSKFRPVAVVGIILASVAGPFVIHERGLAQWRARESLLREQTAQIEQVSAETKRLSKLIADMTRASLSNQQFHELLKLRGGIGRLREEAKELAELKAKQQRLLAAASASALPDRSAVLAYWPKTQLLSAGYANPISALETTLWSMNSNSPDHLWASLTPGAKSKLADMAQTTALWVVSRNDPNVLAGRVAPENAKYGAIATNLDPAERMAVQATAASASVAASSGFYVVGQSVSADEAVLDVYFEGERKLRQVVFKNIDNEWKLDGIYLSGAKDGDGTYLSGRRVSVWP